MRMSHEAQRVVFQTHENFLNVVLGEEKEVSYLW